MSWSKRIGPMWKLAPMALVALAGTGCGYQSVEPGQRALRFDRQGLRPEVLQPGRHHLGWCFLRDCGRLDVFDITYQTKREGIHTPSSEGLALEANVAVVYRPIISELYALNSEIGPDYYEEVIAPEFRSATRSVLARHSFTGLTSKLEKIEDEIQTEVRRRIAGKHVEVASINLEKISYAPEIANAVRAKIVAEQEAVRQKSAIENQALREKLLLETEANKTRMTSQNELESRRLKAQVTLLEKENERKIAAEQATVDLMKVKSDAETRVIRAKAQAQETQLLARATAEENRAKSLAFTPLTVQASAYEALGKLGGSGTTIMLGDYSRAPQFLFPRNLQAGYMNPFVMPGMAPPSIPKGAPSADDDKTSSAPTPTPAEPQVKPASLKLKGASR